MDFLFQIQQYVKGELSYNEAIAIYAKIGTSNALKKLFATGEDDYSTDKLKAEFEKILLNLKVKPASTENFQSYTKSKFESQPLDVTKLPEPLRLEYHKLRSIINEMRNLHAKLPMYGSKDERFAAAIRICSLSTERRVIWDRIDYFKEHGVDHPMFIEKEVIATPTPSASSMSIFEAKHKLILLRSRRTKLKKRTDRLNDFTAIVAEIALLETFIKSETNG